MKREWDCDYGGEGVMRGGRRREWGSGEKVWLWRDREGEGGRGYACRGRRKGNNRRGIGVVSYGVLLKGEEGGGCKGRRLEWG